MLRTIQNFIAHKRILQCEKELKGTTLMDIYETNTIMKLTKQGIDFEEAVERAHNFREKYE